MSRKPVRDSEDAIPYRPKVATRKGEPVEPGPFGRRLDAVMKERGIGPTGLARDSGVPKSTITSLTRGDQKSPSVENAAKLAATLDMAVEYLMDEQGEIILTEIVDRFLESEWALRLVPPFGEEDRKTLQRISPAKWRKAPPNDQAVFHLVQGGRAGTL